MSQKNFKKVFNSHGLQIGSRTDRRHSTSVLVESPRVTHNNPTGSLNARYVYIHRGDGKEPERVKLISDEESNG